MKEYDQAHTCHYDPDIANMFSGLRYSAVSKINTRFLEKSRLEKNLKRCVQQIMAYLSISFTDRNFR